MGVNFTSPKNLAMVDIMKYMVLFPSYAYCSNDFLVRIVNILSSCPLNFSVGWVERLGI